MEIQEILDILKIENLDEDTTTKFSTALRELVESKSKELAGSIVEPLIEDTKKQLREEFESEFESYKDSILSQWSNFVDEQINKTFVIPEKIVEYARLGQLYSPLIEQMKVRIGIDEGSVDEEAKKLLREAQHELDAKDSRINELQSKYFETVKDAEELSSLLYIKTKCNGLSESARERVETLLKGETDVRKIDERFESITELLLKESEDNKENKEIKENLNESAQGVGHSEVPSKDDKGNKITESFFDKWQKDIVEKLRKNA